MNNILAVNFKSKKLVRSGLKTKKECTNLKLQHEKKIANFLKEMKIGLSPKQYIATLEAMASKVHCRAIKNAAILSVLDDYYAI